MRSYFSRLVENCISLLKDFLWLRNITSIKAVVFMAVSVVIAAVIEYVVVYKKNSWAYNASMPRLFGIGISPLVQLVVTGMFAVLLTHKVLDKSGGGDAR